MIWNKGIFCSSVIFLALFGRGGKKTLIAGADEEGSTVLYDLDKRTVTNHIRINEPKDLVIDPVSLALGDALYVMDTIPRPQSRCGFEALAYDTEDEEGRAQDWCWRCLQPPPYVLEPDYKPTPISSYTVVGGANIWNSGYQRRGSAPTPSTRWAAGGPGPASGCCPSVAVPPTSRSTVRGLASRLRCASDLSTASRSNKPSGRLLCASDLSTASKSNKPSSVLLLQEEEMQLLQQELELEGPGRTYVTDSYLVHLGSAKFCAAKFFQHEYYKRGEQIRNFAVLTGVVMDPDSRPLRMTKHKARRYDMLPLCNGWVF